MSASPGRPVRTRIGLRSPRFRYQCSGGGQVGGLPAGFVGGREGCGHGIEASGVGDGAVEGGAEHFDAPPTGLQDDPALDDIASCCDHREAIGEFSGVESPSAGRIDLLRSASAWPRLLVSPSV